ncbi:MAG: nitroreductase family protein [Planctomycetaceae bacterium]|jgi:ferredoxin|nr:nitroreductase family protein [Planctomycetaceae bacterium]
MPRLQFAVAEDKCIRCDACVKDCPTGIVARTGRYPTVLPESESGCIRCQHCLAICPTGAVSVFGLNPENGIALTKNNTPSLEQMEILMRGRRSVRQFKHENVSRELIDRLLKTLANVPTGCNDSDLTFSVVDDQGEIKILLETLVRMLEVKIQSGVEVLPFLAAGAAAYRENGTDIFFRGAPHLLIVSAGEKATCAKEDIDLTLAYFELLAHSAGLGATWCGMLKFAADTIPELRSTLGLEPDTPFYAMMFGFPAVKYARTVQRDTAAIVRRLQWN